MFPPLITTSLVGALLLVSFTSASHISSKMDTMPLHGISLIYPADGVDSGESYAVGMKFDYRDHVMGILFFAQYELIKPDGTIEILTSYNNVIKNSSSSDPLIEATFTAEYPFWNGTRAPLTPSCHMFNKYELSTLLAPTNMTGLFKVRWEMAVGTPSYVDRMNPVLCNGTYELQRLTDEKTFNVTAAKSLRPTEQAAKTTVLSSVEPTGLVYVEPNGGGHDDHSSASRPSAGILGGLVGVGFALAGAVLMF
ncbi:hypothetical protein FRB96_005827 [Tulasnella sp. 330]|nr:hypothetical protein FRB96_005827 [Tulasnella sp. 330]